MPRIQVTRLDGSETTVVVDSGLTLMEGLRSAVGDELLALCGGACACATCHVIVAPEWRERMGAAQGDEHELLGESPFNTEGSRLSCQITVGPEHEGLAVTIVPED